MYYVNLLNKIAFRHCFNPYFRYEPFYCNVICVVIASFKLPHSHPS